MKFDAIEGHEMQVESTGITIHTGDDVNEKAEELKTKLQKIFEGEFGNKIVRISYQRGNSSFAFNAGFEENMYNEVTDYIKKVAAREYRPLTFTALNFLSFSPLRDVTNDSVGD